MALQRQSRVSECFNKHLSLLVAGDVNIGKTSLSRRFVSGLFLPVLPTLGFDFHVRNVVMNDRQIVQVLMSYRNQGGVDTQSLINEVRIWDIAGTENNHTLTPLILRRVQGFMLIYDCTRPSSFQNIPQWTQVLRDYLQLTVPCVLVANKTDMKKERAILPDDGAALAKDLGAVGFFETSAVDGSNVDAAFLTLVEAILKTDVDAASEATELLDATVDLNATNVTTYTCAI